MKLLDSAPARLATYAAGLAVAFGAAFGLAGVVVPDSTVAAWTERSQNQNHSDMQNTHNQGDNNMPGMDHGSDGNAAEESLNGLSLSAGGYVLSPVSAPSAAGRAGELSFRITDTTGRVLTSYTRGHEKDLHLIVVRSDGRQFRHVHPTLDASTGTWSIPWTWAQAGSYRVYADFVSGPTDQAKEGTAVTLTRTVEVAGTYSPQPQQPTRVDEVDGYTVTLAGDITAGDASAVTITVARGQEKVTTLQPYLGAFGHLVALRDGDLAYLHAHAEGEDPKPGETAGPDIKFAVHAPTAGRYLLYLDFQVDGKVRTAEFVVDAAGQTTQTTAPTTSPTTSPTTEPSSSPSGSETGSGDGHSGH